MAQSKVVEHKRKKVKGQFSAYLKSSLSDREDGIAYYDINWTNCTLHIETTEAITVDGVSETYQDSSKNKKVQQATHDNQVQIIKIISLPKVHATYRDKTAELSIYDSELRVSKLVGVLLEEKSRLQYIEGELTGHIELGGPASTENDQCSRWPLVLFLLPLLLLAFVDNDFGFFIPFLIAGVYYFITPTLIAKHNCNSFLKSLVERINPINWLLVVIQISTFAWILYDRYYRDECVPYTWLIWVFACFPLCHWLVKGWRVSFIIPTIIWFLSYIFLYPQLCDSIISQDLNEIIDEVRDEKMDSKELGNQKENDRLDDLEDGQNSKESQEEDDKDVQEASSKSKDSDSKDKHSDQSRMNPPPTINPEKLELTKKEAQEKLCGFSQEISDSLLFDTARSDLKENGKFIIKDIASWINTLHKQYDDKISVEVLGFADHRGSEVFNKELSRMRALTIRKYLAKYNVDRFILSSKGMGEIQEGLDTRDDKILRKYRKVYINVHCEDEE